MLEPFSTAFGREPKNLIQRIKESQEIIEDFNSEEPFNFTYLITGVRGSGKTVLLSYISKILKDKDNWIVIDISSKTNMIETIASEIYEVGKLKHMFLKTEFNFSFQGFSLNIKGENPVSSALVLLKKMLDVVKKKGKRILLTIDEVDNSEQMKEFVQIYQSLIRLDYPLMLLMTGLYDNIFKLQNEKALTFLYRAPKIYLGSLPIQNIAFSYKKYLGIDDSLAKEMAELTKGYAYAYQVLGYLMFKKEEKGIDEELLLEFDQYLLEYVYEKLYSELPRKERQFLEAMENGNNSIESIRKKVEVESKELGVYRSRLIRKGIIRSPMYGYVEFALPRFKEFIDYKDTY